MEKINIAELLKDCPKGMELDCVMYDKVQFDIVQDGNAFPIKIKTPEGRVSLSKYGCFSLNSHCKCVIFPKGKTTWEGFVPPCKFKDGDIIFTHTNSSKCNLDNCWVSIFKEYRNNRCACYVCLCLSGLELYHDKWEDELLCELCEIEENRLATEEEKQKLFDAIKANGYKWNAETKTLDKLIEPSFKVGDKVRHKNNHGVVFTITSIEEDSYVCGAKAAFWFDDQDDYELVPNKFDITTLKPFESRVLVRDDGYSIWQPCMWGLYDKGHKFPYVTTGCRYRYCIPFEGNQHLLGTTDDCDEFYKTWE